MNNRKFIYGSAFVILSAFMINPLLSNNGNNIVGAKIPANHPPINRNESCASCHGDASSYETKNLEAAPGKYGEPPKKGR